MIGLCDTTGAASVSVPSIPTSHDRCERQTPSKGRRPLLAAWDDGKALHRDDDDATPGLDT